MNEGDLQRAGVYQAEAIIVLPNLHASHPLNEDAMNILTAEMIMKLNTNKHLHLRPKQKNRGPCNVILQLIKWESITLLRKEIKNKIHILCLEALTYRLLAQVCG